MGGMTRLLLLLWAGVTVSTAMDLYKRITVAECDNNQRHHHVKLKLPRGEKDICGCTLISDHWILTAAHCRDEPMTAYLGLHPSTGKKKQSMKIEGKPVPSPKGYDIMLVKLPKAVKPEDIQPVDLPTTNDCKNPPKIGDTVQIAGFGPRIEDGPLSDTLRCAKTEVVKCPEGIDPVEFCGNTETVKALKADSGGGVLFNNKIYGVISQGGSHPAPMFFVDVCENLDWIKKEIKK